MNKYSILCLLFAMSFSLAGTITHTVTIQPDQLQINKLDGYDIFFFHDHLSTWEKGKPLLPVKTISFVIPPNAELSQVELINSESIILTGTYVPYPVQAIRPLSSKEDHPFVPPDPLVYDASEPYPATIVGTVPTGCLGGYRIATILINPVQYLPANRKIRLFTRLDIKISYQEHKYKTIELTQSQADLLGEQASTMVANPEAVTRWAPVIHTVKQEEIDCIIITSSGLSSYWQPFKDWKTKKGINTEIITTNSIYSQYPGRDNQEKIRNCIIDYWSTKGLKWVLLGGDDFIVPDRKTRLIIEDSTITGNIPTDMYYADLQWSWDGNSNNLFGEMQDTVDLLHDVFVGRAPVDNANNIATFIHKDTMFEKYPEVNYLEKLLLPSEILFPPYHGSIINNLIADYFPGNWQKAKLEDPWSGQVRDSLSAGFQFCHISAHGNTSSLSVLDMSEVHTLNNGTKYNIMNAINCYCGAFDGGDCIAESLVNYPNGGCIATMLNSRYGLGYPPALGPSEMLDIEFYKSLLNRNCFHVGTAHAMSKNVLRSIAMSQAATRWCVFCQTLFGDPTLPMFSNAPATMDITHDATTPLGPNILRVSAIVSGTPVPGALVCLMKEPDVYAVGQTNSSGWIDLFVNPSSGGTIQITVTARDCHVYEGSCTVTGSVSQPCLVYNSHTIDDASGNNDGHLDPGETADLMVTLKNLGDLGATNVSGILQTSCGDITLIDSTASYGTINAGDSISGQFTVAAASSAAQGKHIEFIIDATADQGNWEPFFSDTIGVPPGPRFMWADHDTCVCAFTVTTNGSFGLTFPYGEGSGFKYSKLASYGCLFYASMLCGTDDSYIADRFYSHPSSTIDDDFAIVETLQCRVPPSLADEEHIAVYNDSGHPAPKGLEIHQSTMSVAEDGYDDWVIMCFDYFNQGSSPISNFYSGLMFDFDIYNNQSNIVRSDSTRRFIYMMRRTSSQYPTAGLRLLEPETVANISAIDHALYVDPSSMMTEAVKDSFLSGKIQALESDRRDNWSICVSAGPFDIPVGEKVKVVYAIVGGNDANLAIVHSDSAQSWWDQNSVASKEYPLTSKHAETCRIHPNPSREDVAITLTSVNAERLTVRIYDISGRVVDEVFTGTIHGSHTVHWQPSDISAGIYFVHVEKTSGNTIKKVILMR